MVARIYLETKLFCFYPECNTTKYLFFHKSLTQQSDTSFVFTPSWMPPCYLQIPGISPLSHDALRCSARFVLSDEQPDCISDSNRRKRTQTLHVDLCTFNQGSRFLCNTGTEAAAVVCVHSCVYMWVYFVFVSRFVLQSSEAVVTCYFSSSLIKKYLNFLLGIKQVSVLWSCSVWKHKPDTRIT